ncbi:MULTISPECIES: MFS transporter [unclassified Streptomyces]|uniref:MFS transporter n=1 Tax=unclassified Streptomyces TaxID=2593676 RepID=UPI00035C8AF9|nr:MULTISPECIES: MFS transporter [unclassified Streptomyces]MYT34027.1 MFS transporter [Streptomyces sp. SID8354]
MPRDLAEGQRERWGLVAVAGICAFLAMFDMSVVTVAVPGIATGFAVPVSVAQWAVLAYQLPVVALLLPAGRWLDRAPLRPVVLGALAGFGLCGAAAAGAPVAAVLIVARLLQGVCGAVLFVLMPLLALRAVRPELRGRAMSVPATLGPLGAVTGPALGGVLLDHWGWRAVLLVKLPLCALAWWLARRGLAPGGRPGAPGRAEWRAAAPAAVAVAALLLGLTSTAEGWTAPLLCGLALAAGAVWARGADGRRVRAALRSARTGAIHGAVLALAAAFAAVHFLLAVDLQRAEGVSASATGLALLGFPAAMAVAGPVGGRLADRYGPRPVAVAGAALVAVGFGLLATAGAWTPLPVAWRLAVAGLGMGLYGGPAQLMALEAAGPERMATAGSTVQLARSAGFALGPAAATALATAGGIRTGPALATAAALLAALLLARRPGRCAAATAGRTRSTPP